MRTALKVVATIALVIVATLALAEVALRRLYGLGNPVLYDSHPLYGYRLRPNQRVGREGGAVIAVNNLGLRADRDWDANPEDKVLFLGDSVSYGGSYVSNDELFSTLAVRQFPGFTSGNAAVNGWGVENVHGLVVGTEFLPARVYVTVLPEGDFYRGLNRISGQPVWCRKPNGALHEVAFYYLNRIHERRYRAWETRSTADKKRVVEAAAAKLAEMDQFLRRRGFLHRIYITPTRAQVLGRRGRDANVEAALRDRGLEVVYLADRLVARRLSTESARAFFHDNVHLSIAGHRLWGEIIGADLRQAVPGR